MEKSIVCTAGIRENSSRELRRRGYDESRINGIQMAKLGVFVFIKVRGTRCKHISIY